jgi:TonB family protein
MNAYLNYLIEANLGIALFLGAYLLILSTETEFKLQRMFLLLGVLVSLTFPLLHIEFDSAVFPSLGKLMPPHLLPEIVIESNRPESAISETTSLKNVWFYIVVLYIGITLFFFTRFIARISNLIIFLRKSQRFSIGRVKIVESSDDSTPTFSFFNIIVLGDSKKLSADERRKVIHHETVHVDGYHSIDILLVNLLGIFFWFNPLISIYKKIFVQLHEFEADARAVENRDVNEYCNLLAKVALESAGFKLANHFNNSLTLKRIKMMKTIKRKIRPWKMFAMAGVIPLTFAFIACQDQIANEVADIAQSSSMATDVPKEVLDQYDILLKANPGKTFLLMETDENMKPKVEEMKKKMESLSQNQIAHITLLTPTVTKDETPRTFAIVEYTDKVSELSERSKLSDDVYTIVEETAMPRGGWEVFYQHVMTKLKYPLQARRMGVEGKVFVEFVVLTDGSITDVRVKNGIGAGCDAEAVEIVKSSPLWEPGKNKGVAVKQRVVLPIAFKLNQSIKKDVTSAPANAVEEVVVVGKNSQ